ncbi:hypothetical protein ACH4VT_33670 [Streptomyces lydicus]|uniref:hypothetical protein n=1 Tax=Streptomyces lydicus TaxID=47763 RepID=UPI003799ECCE
MNDKHRTPEELRGLLRGNYPEDVEEFPHRRQRRRAKKAYRRQQVRATHEWVREEREKEPTTAAGAIALVVLLVLIGVVVHWLTPSDSDGHGTETGKRTHPTVTVSPHHTPTPSPSATPSVAADDSDAVAQAWARAYYSRNPPQDRTHRGVAERASRLMTKQLTANLSEHSDPDWDKLVSRGGISTVTGAKVSLAGTDLPADTPLRVWRQIAVTIKVAGYTHYTDTRTVQAELSRLGDQWRVSRVLGL